MDENETIDYLTDDVADKMTTMTQHLTVIEAATQYGYQLDPWEDKACETAQTDIEHGIDSETALYNGDLEDDIATLARWSVRYLNDNGVVPRTYEHGQKDTHAGTGNETARRDGARLYGAAWVTA